MTDETSKDTISKRYFIDMSHRIQQIIAGQDILYEKALILHENVETPYKTYNKVSKIQHLRYAKRMNVPFTE